MSRAGLATRMTILAIAISAFVAPGGGTALPQNQTLTRKAALDWAVEQSTTVYDRVLPAANPADRDTGLVRFGARDYDATVGRWTAADPIGFSGGGANLKEYAANDPINLVDPQGLYWTDDAMTSLANVSAGFGDGISSVLTLGLYTTADFRRDHGIGGVDQCSAWYKGGKVAGYAEGTALLWAAGLNGGSNSTFWSGYQYGARAAAETIGTTLEKTVIGSVMDTIEHRIGYELPKVLWKAASATFAANASEATAVIRAAGATWTGIEEPILAARGIAINFVP